MDKKAVPAAVAINILPTRVASTNGQLITYNVNKEPMQASLDAVAIKIQATQHLPGPGQTLVSDGNGRLVVATFTGGDNNIVTSNTTKRVPAKATKKNCSTTMLLVWIALMLLFLANVILAVAMYDMSKRMHIFEGTASPHAMAPGPHHSVPLA